MHLYYKTCFTPLRFELIFFDFKTNIYIRKRVALNFAKLPPRNLPPSSRVEVFFGLTRLNRFAALFLPSTILVPVKGENIKFRIDYKVVPPTFSI